MADESVIAAIELPPLDNMDGRLTDSELLNYHLGSLEWGCLESKHGLLALAHGQ